MMHLYKEYVYGLFSLGRCCIFLGAPEKGIGEILLYDKFVWLFLPFLGRLIYQG